MDIESTLKDEIFRPLATTIVPGAFAIGPYILVAGYYVPTVAQFWNDHPSAFVTLSGFFVVAAGLILEDLGSEIEVCWLDKRMKSLDADFENTWFKYLQLTENEQNSVGLRYLRTVHLRFKFELSLIPALFFMMIGLIWLNVIYKYLACTGTILLPAFILVLIAYLSYEARQGAKLLHDVRKQVLLRAPLKT